MFPENSGVQTYDAFGLHPGPERGASPQAHGHACRALSEIFKEPQALSVEPAGDLFRPFQASLRLFFRVV